ncbi:MAG: lysophospholipid acyltransferase family protein [Lentisphaeria bacterium]|nr:lysophospholipid acyltransferase family protein [Lentisphaeria bacterium]
MSWKGVRRTVSDPAAGLIFWLCIHLLGALPIGVMSALASAGSWALYLFPTTWKRISLANLAIAFPEWDDQRRRRVCRKSFYHVFVNVLEFLRSIRKPERVHERMRLDERTTRLYEEVRNGDRVCFFVLPHLGSWELLGHAANAWTGKVRAVANEFRNPHVERLIRGAREKTGMGVISDKGAARGVVRACREGVHLALLIDQNTRVQHGGVFVDFFGLPVTMSRLPATLARRFDAHIVASAGPRTGDHYEMSWNELPKETSEYGSDRELTQALAAQFEQVIRQYPEQYLWTYRRWRYIPADCTPEMRERYPFYARDYEYQAGEEKES